MITIILNGLFVGLIYGLLAVGLVTIYRVSRIVNFAYGETGMIAAFVYLELRRGTTHVFGSGGDQGVVVSLLVAVALGAVLGAALELCVARPLRKRSGSTLNGLVGTIAASLLLLTFAIDRYGTDVFPVEPLVAGAGVRLAGIIISPAQLLIGAFTVAVLLALAALYRFTSVGSRLRATAIDPYAASLIGVNIDLTCVAVWATAGVLSALSAVLIAPLVAMNAYFMTGLALRSFAAALIGGLTSLWGGFVAGLLLGVAESVIAYKSPIRGVTDVLMAVGILALMVVRPAGLVRAHY